MKTFDGNRWNSNTSTEINVKDFGVVGDGVTDDRSKIQTAINTAGSLGLPLVFDPNKTYLINSFLKIDSPVTIFGRGATISSKGTTSAFNINSSYVTIEDIKIEGKVPDAYTPSERGIISLGTEANPFYGCHLKNVSVNNMRDTAIRCDWWIDGVIEGGTLSNIVYAGIIAQSAQRLKIYKVRVDEVHKQTADQCYGISITDNINTEAGRSRDCSIDSCTISNIPDWTALSTHGGERISFTNNRVIGCYRGIIYGAGNPTRVVAADDGLVVGNIVNGAGKYQTSSTSAGISVIGSTSGAVSTVYRSGNLITNYALPYTATTNGRWVEDIQIFGSDTGFPQASSNIMTDEVLVDKITVPPAPFDRNISVVSSVYAVSTSTTNRGNLVLYVNGNVIGRTRRAMQGASVPESFVATGFTSIPLGNTPTVVEVKMVLSAGTGTMTTSATDKLTSTTATVTRT